MAKAVLACVDCYLVLNKKYNFSYKKRVEIFLNNSEDMEYFDLVNWALNEKLRPQEFSMSSSDVKKCIQGLVNFLLNIFLSVCLNIINVQLKMRKMLKEFIYINQEIFLSES